MSWRLGPVAVLAYAVAAGTPPGPPDYKGQIEPIFKARCSPCHTGSQAKGGLSLESFDRLKQGGISGPMVVSGHPEKSVLLDRILGKGGKPRMPMGFKPLSEADTNLIRDWIKAGAKNSGATVKKHWAYVAPIRPPVPKVKDGGWSVNPIDRFVWDRLAKEGLKPSPEADKTTLLRRVTLDLTGLPPTPAEVDAFHADKSPDAYEKVVDRLLASPHFGERMALPWLDAARYADSNGFQQDGDTYQYVWRDWVVRAINSDMPFDQFTTEQLAGDLLPKPTVDQLVATAFNRNHMLNGEGGAIPEEQRNVVLFDRVDTTSTTWLGLTMACARCHDHKYDPLSQRDYFSLMAFFNNVPETGVPPGGGQYRIADPWIYAGSPEQTSRLRAAEKRVAEAEKERAAYLSSPAFGAALTEWISRVRSDLADARGANVAFEPWREVGTFTAESFDNAFATSFGPEREPPRDGKPRPEWTDGTVVPLSGDNTAIYLLRRIRSNRAATYLFSFGSDDAVKAWLNAEEILSVKATRAAVPDSELVRVTLRPGENTLLLKIVNGGGMGGFYFKPHPGGVKEDVAALLTDEGDAKVREYFARVSPPATLRQLDDAAKRAVAELDAVRAEMPRVMVMSDAKPRKTHVLSRGNYEEPLNEVKPAAPKVLPPLPSGKVDRLALARWMTSPSNPLTARVQVNRIWQTLFGNGLVRTPENFGVQGEPPSHPELLDWLAVDFRESGWKVKSLVKMLAMSRTYRQSSKVTPALLRKDPDNRLLARGARYRLPSMLLRDVALASSGLLDPRIGGKPVYPYQPPGIWDGLAITKERDFTYPQSKGAENHRRSLYTFWRRTVAPGNMFDASSRQICTVRPSRTSTPLHALTMLNDVTWVEAGRALASRVMALPRPEDRLREAFRRVCARRPQADELRILLRGLNRSLGEFRTDAARAYLAQGDAPVDPKADPVELAAYASVCLAIYNLDEAMTRE